MTSAEIENTKRKLYGEYVPVSNEELSSNELERWDNAAAKIAQIQSSAVARVDGSAGPKWWQVSPSHWAVLFTLLTLFDLATGHYVMALCSALLAGVDWLWVVRSVKALREAATVPAQEALDAADAEITRVLESAEQYDTEAEARQHLGRVAAQALAAPLIDINGRVPPPHDAELVGGQVGGQSDAALWRYVNSRPAPRAPAPAPRPSVTDLHNLLDDSSREASDNARIQQYNDRVPARLMTSTSNNAHLALMTGLYNCLET